jgi:glycosyltransferase involved in cell wall biosynthesis
VVPSNEDDMRELLALDDTLPMALVPIGFDASAYAPDPAAPRHRDRIIFHGAMSYAPNVVCAERLARDLLPLVRRRRADAHLVIVGRDPAPEVRALGALAGVRVVGGVDDMRGWIATSAVWAGPFTIGTGIKTKLLEAMATNTPAVVTPVGGRGLDLGSRAFLVGSSDGELAAHLCSVLDDQDRARVLGERGGAYVRARYDWPAVGRALERVYEEVVAEKRVPAG